MHKHIITQGSEEEGEEGIKGKEGEVDGRVGRKRDIEEKGEEEQRGGDEGMKGRREGS